MTAPGDEEIIVRLFAGLETLTRDRVTELRLPLAEAPTLVALFDRLGLPPTAAGLRLVNGRHAGPDDPLGAGDEVSLFPPLGGG